MSARWLAFGGVVASLGGLLAISWLIFVKQAHETYWQWPGTLGLAAMGLGFVGLIAGFVLKDEKADPGQQQQGGTNSVNLQAGHDITIRNNTEGNRE
jgi:hypothetical protein